MTALVFLPIRHAKARANSDNVCPDIHVLLYLMFASTDHSVLTRALVNTLVLLVTANSGLLVFLTGQLSHYDQAFSAMATLKW